MTLLFSLAAIVTGFLLDLILGDPPGVPHIVRLMGVCISRLEKLLRRIFPKNPRGELWGGALMAAAVIIVFTAPVFIVLFFAYRFSPYLGFAAESLLIWQCLAMKSLRVESMKVYGELESGDILRARKSVSMIVGRDTENLDEAGVTRAAVETVAESTSDGVIAPMLYIMLGGAALGVLYKAVNTMDSMVGYKNGRYMYFGRPAARLDDVFGWLPSRLTAMLMIISAAAARLDARGAYRIWRRDRKSHASPNSGQSESACAGALGVRLVGPAAYSGVPHQKPYIGDDFRPVVPGDIKSANRLMYASAYVMLAFAAAVRGVVYIAII